MVEFSSYITPMDRGYGTPSAGETSTTDVGVGVEDIGWGLPMGLGAQNIQGIAAKIREGAGNLEIQFPGAGRGQRQSQTPGMYGEEQRQAIREMAAINEINVTIHAPFGLMGFAGMDQQSGNFSKEQRKMAVDEIKRSIDFAADVAKGGSVVVHTGEFQRPISEEAWAKDDSGRQIFKAYEEEPEQAVIRVLDKRTGQVMTQVRKNQRVPRPVWLRNEEGQYVDYEGNVVDRKKRVPEFDPKTGRFKVELYGWDRFQDEANEVNKENAEKAGMSIQEYKQEYYAKADKNGNMYLEPEEVYLRATLEANEGHSKGWALQYAQGFEKHQESLAKMKKALSFYEKIEESTPEEERWKLARQVPEELSHLGLTPVENKLPSEIIKERIDQTQKAMEYEHEASVSQQQLATESAETQKHITSVRKYALEESYKSYAEGGIHALDETRAKKLEKPVFITLEHVFPEAYGGHPDELKSLIMKSRDKMADMLVQQRGYSQQEAEKAAVDHIKATIDTGHINMWRKYWQNDPSKSMTENDRSFKNWILNKMEDLAKSGIVGNVHLADNYGYQDEHLTPGDGSSPIKEMVKIFRKYGYEGPLTVEGGAAATTDVSDFHALMKTWRLFGSPVYGAHGPVARVDKPRRSWGDIQYSYFGQTTPPYYVFGPYAPSQDWSLWSQTPME